MSITVKVGLNNSGALGEIFSDAPIPIPHKYYVKYIHIIINFNCNAVYAFSSI